jgi:aryl-alcohol dehydrogenase-like predicted oxidoreductase
LAWAIANTDVSSCILGFTRLSQVEENLKALELYYKWTPEIEKRVRDILENEPEATTDFRKWGPMPQRRDVALKAQK